jgi:hypothetical protein
MQYHNGLNAKAGITLTNFIKPHIRNYKNIKIPIPIIQEDV